MAKKTENNISAIERRKQDFSNLLSKDEFIKSLEKVVPKHITPERVVKTALVAASRQPKLFECTKQSFLQAVMRSAELGLDCSGTLGQGYLVPYYNSKIQQRECQFIAGYQGLISLARRSGDISRIESRIVYYKDRFDVQYGLDQKLIHEPFLGGDRGDIVCVYAIAELKDGSKQLEIMTIDEVNSIKARSKAKDDGPWKTDFGEMARKTVIRRIVKYLPMSTELQKAIEVDDLQFDFDNYGKAIEDVKAGVEGLKERLGRKKVESGEIGPEEVVDPKFEEKKKKAVDKLKKAEKKAKREKETLEPDEPTAKYQCSRCEQRFPVKPANNQCTTCFGKVGEIVPAKAEYNDIPF